MNKNVIAGAIVGTALLFGFGLHAAVAAPVVVTKTVTVTAPAPTPQVVTVTVPGPSVRVEVTPQVCVDAINGMADLIILDSEVIDGLVNETLTEAQVDDYIAASETVEDLVALAQQCLAGTDIGS